jgi:hypothetical protein
VKGVGGKRRRPEEISVFVTFVFSETPGTAKKPCLLASLLQHRREHSSRSVAASFHTGKLLKGTFAF